MASGMIGCTGIMGMAPKGPYSFSSTGRPQFSGTGVQGIAGWTGMMGTPSCCVCQKSAPSGFNVDDKFERKKDQKRYVKKIPCISCGKELEIPVSNSTLSRHGHWKRKCPYCGKKWRVSTCRALLGNIL